MKKVAVTSLAGLVFLSLTLFLAGCGGSTSNKIDQPDVVPLPADSTVTLEQVDAPDANAEGKLYLGDTTTGQVFEVKTDPDSWLSGYQWISPNQLIVAGYYHDFFLLDLTAKTLHRLPDVPATSSVSFSHSGEFMAVIGPNNDLMIWSVMDAKQVSDISTGPIGYSLWSPDDTRIFWPGAPSGAATTDAQPVNVSIDTGGGALSARWSNDGKSIVFSDTDGFYSTDATTGVKTKLYTWPAGTTLLPDTPKLSPDGKYALVSARDAAGNGFRALVVPLDGSSKGVQITGVWPADVEWSSTEDVVAAVADWCQPTAHLLLVNADGTTRSTIEGATQIPFFSDDGTQIAYVGPDPESGTNEGLVVRSATGVSVATFLPGVLRDDVWSPDARWVAYTPGPVSYQCMDTSGTTQVLPFP